MNYIPYFPLLIFFVFSGCNKSQKVNDYSNDKLWNESERKYLLHELARTRENLMLEIKDLNDAQWNFKENADRWSIAQIVEHLEVQDEMYFREMDVILKRPETPEFVDIVKDNDSLLLAYATDPTKGNAGYLEPINRFCSKENATSAFIRIRNMIIAVVETTGEDLRKHFTFRNYSDDGGLTKPGLYDIRDLHQLMLTCIAHTDRHLNQIRNVEKNESFPKE